MREIRAAGCRERLPGKQTEMADGFFSSTPRQLETALRRPVFVRHSPQLGEREPRRVVNGARPVWVPPAAFYPALAATRAASLAS